MRTLEPANRVRIGALAIAVVVLVVGVGQSFSSLPMLFATASYYGQFSDSGGLSKDDKVRIVGMDVGTVQDVKIDGDHVVMKFTTGTRTIGTESRLAIRTDTILGKKVLEIEPRGTQPLRPGGVLPLGQSTTPYQIYDAFFDVTKAAAGWNIETVKKSLNVLSHTIDQTYPHLSAALDGVAKFSDTLGKRDAQLKHLLAEARKVAGVLGDRSKQINALLANAQELLAAFNERGRAIQALLVNVSAFSTQVRGLINDNPNLHHLLEQLRTVTDVLVAHKNDLVSVLSTLRNYTAALSEAVGSGPYFKVMIANLLPYQILQPWVDAAFKKRGIDPENFWRSAGLPAFRWPDPNGTRFPNGAPPPAPPVLEGTPDHPGPAVAPGSPCSYAPPLELPAAAGQPDALRGCRSRPRSLRAQRAISGVARCALVAAEPERPAPGAGDPDRRAARRPGARAAGHTGAVAAESAAGRPHRRLATGRSDSATVDVCARAATRTAQRHRGPARSYRPRSSRPAGREVVANEHDLRYPQAAAAATVARGGDHRITGYGRRSRRCSRSGWQLYKKLTNNTVVAYFPAANALYAGDKVEIMGIRVGAIDKIEPAGDKMKVTFHYRNKYKVPANASAVILNPTLVASRSIQLEPPYKGGPTLPDNAVIPEERTQVPVEWDDLRNDITHIISQLGPTKEQKQGAIR